MTTFFSVDVEATSTHYATGRLLSIGIQVVNEDLSLGADFYRTVFHHSLVWDEDTLLWWMDQDREIFKASRIDPASENTIAYVLSEFVQRHMDDKAVFVANPAAYEWPWIDNLFADFGLINPFDYHPLCIRSMYFGMTDSKWGESRKTWKEFSVESEKPHHALYDAKAQAEEFIRLIKAKGYG